VPTRKVVAVISSSSNGSCNSTNLSNKGCLRAFQTSRRVQPGPTIKRVSCDLTQGAGDTFEGPKSPPAAGASAVLEAGRSRFTDRDPGGWTHFWASGTPF